MSPARWSPPSIWEEDGPGVVPPSDILADERERRLRRRSGFRAFWPGNWLTGRVGVAALLLFLAAGIAWLGFRQWESGAAVPPSSHLAASGPVVPERVRDLTAPEFSLASRYGVPLYLGDGGRPVVQVETDGPIRELTSFEMKLDSPVSFLPSRRGRVVQVAGPRGWGMWWLDDSETASLRPLLSFDRLSWRERQERELSRTVRGILLGMVLIDGLDFDLWETGMGELLIELASMIKGPYPPAMRGHWSAVPGLWVCDEGLESDLHQGVGPGCPGAGYDDALQEAWTHAGSAVDRLEGMGRYVNYVDGMDSAELHGSMALADLSHEILDLARDFRDLRRSLERLRQVSREWGLSIAVDFSGGR